MMSNTSCFQVNYIYKGVLIELPNYIDRQEQYDIWVKARMTSNIGIGLIV